jgi:hypothetical protein
MGDIARNVIIFTICKLKFLRNASCNIGIINLKFDTFFHPKEKHVVQKKRTEGWRRFLSDELHNSSSQNIVTFTKRRTMRWVGQKTFMRDFRLPPRRK